MLRDKGEMCDRVLYKELKGEMNWYQVEVEGR